MCAFDFLLAAKLIHVMAKSKQQASTARGAAIPLAIESEHTKHFHKAYYPPEM